jgi:REP element-mobilizing transposase RayT
MTYNPAKHHRHSIRLPGYDYTRSGEIVNGEMQLNQYGQIVAQTYQWLSQRYPYICLDEWIVMPNHFHGIMVITDNPCKGERPFALTITVPMWNHPHNNHTDTARRSLY